MSVKIVTPSDFGSPFDTTTDPTKVNLKYATPSELVAGTANRVANVADVAIRSKLWASGQAIIAGERRHVTANGIEYVALSNHTAAAGNKPGTTGGNAVWRAVNDVPYWEPNIAYKTGDIVKMQVFGMENELGSNWPYLRVDLEARVRPLRWVAVHDHTSATGKIWSDSNAPCIRTRKAIIDDTVVPQIYVYGRGSHGSVNPYWRLHEDDLDAFYAGTDYISSDRPAFMILLKYARHWIRQGMPFPFIHATCLNEPGYPSVLQRVLEDLSANPVGTLGEVVHNVGSFRYGLLYTNRYTELFNFEGGITTAEDYIYCNEMYGVTQNVLTMRNVFLSYFAYVVCPAMVEFHQTFSEEQLFRSETFSSLSDPIYVDISIFFESYMGY